eukprot:Sspe_Gene.116620::Locus_106255_Transcript_1_1_Confidence_1.000_Length_1043::g.116620::m.116620
MTSKSLSQAPPLQKPSLPPQQNVPLESLALVKLTESTRESFAAFYLAMQTKNPNFAALRAAPEDIHVYGGVLYDVCTIEPCVSMVWLDRDSGDVIGCYLAALSENLDAVDETKLGGCAGHLAMVKHFQKTISSMWELKGKERLVHHAFTGIREEYVGKGLFGPMGDGALLLQYEHKCPYTWSYTTNPVMASKALNAKDGLRVANRSSSAVVRDLLDGMLPTLLSSPEWLINFVKATLQGLGYIPNVPLYITDLSRFRYKGTYPFKARKSCVVSLYKPALPAVGKAKL